MFALSAGQIVADKYRIDGIIGAGGMGVVVSATHLELDQKVALKFLRSSDPESLSRFQREARLIVRLKSVHVARVFDVGSIDDETPYIVMELLEGEDLSKIVERQGRLSVEQAVDWVLEGCEAVAEAHSLGMIHRDLKPANLFLSRGPGGTGSIKVLDFGIGKRLEGSSETTTGGLTNEGVALGSPGYMAPEQMTSSRDVDEGADIYSLGAILYRLCGGQNPYKGDSLVSILASMAMTPLAPLSSIVPTVPERFSQVVIRCLSQDRGDRHRSVAELARDIAPFGSRRGRASADQIMATMGVAPASLPPQRQESDPGLTLTSATPRPHESHPPPHNTFGLADTVPLTETVVQAAVSKIPSHPSYPPLASYTPAARSDTSPDQRRLAEQRSMNVLFALGAGALLAGAIAWVGFTGNAREPAAPTAPPQPVPVFPIEPAPLPTPVLIAPPPSGPIPTVDPPPAPTRSDPKPKPAPKPRPTHKPDGIPSPTSIPDGRR